MTFSKTNTRCYYYNWIAKVFSYSMTCPFGKLLINDAGFDTQAAVGSKFIGERRILHDHLVYVLTIMNTPLCKHITFTHEQLQLDLMNCCVITEWQAHMVNLSAIMTTYQGHHHTRAHTDSSSSCLCPTSPPQMPTLQELSSWFQSAATRHKYYLHLLREHYETYVVTFNS